ncbi:efflux transporter outer membrane subunit [Orrella marina]|uniref:RND transporter n=1 Tax=Orrella marina TaxID=2163011 RepID=A0A2R4XF43_9BURK|nr:efflux transporter outer membrane subunit [Orrella marina]AWB32432.1 RND transporter [Orrella marina]
MALVKRPLAGLGLAWARVASRPGDDVSRPVSVDRPGESGRKWPGARHTTILTIVTGVIVSLSACSFAPPYEQPDSPVPGQYPVASAEPLVRLGWEDYFTDPRLQVLIRSALENNRELEVMTLRIREAQALYGIERSSLYPGLRADAGASRVGLPGEVSPLGTTQTITQYSVAGIASWELDFWGRIRNLNEAALRNYLVTESAQQAAALTLIAQVASTYYAIAAIDDQLDIAQEAVSTRQRTYDMFRRRHAVGSGTRLEVAEAETLLTQAQAMVAELGQQRQSRLNQLAVLTADYSVLSAMQATGDAIQADLSLPEIGAGLPSELLLFRPDIVAAENRLKGANANIGVARAAFFPSVTLNGAVAGVSTDLSGLFDSASRAWLFSPSLSLPIFDGQRLQNNLDLAQVRKEIAVVEYEKAIEQAFREVSDALADREALQQRVQIQRRAVQAQSERARLVRLRFERGSSSYFEVLDAQRALLQVEQELVRQELALVLAGVRLYAALGADPIRVSGQSSERLADAPQNQLLADTSRKQQTEQVNTDE